jgi:hypothetical protein
MTMVISMAIKKAFKCQFYTKLKNTDYQLFNFLKNQNFNMLKLNCKS